MTLSLLHWSIKLKFSVSFFSSLFRFSLDTHFPFALCEVDAINLIEGQTSFVLVSNIRFKCLRTCVYYYVHWGISRPIKLINAFQYLSVAVSKLWMFNIYPPLIIFRFNEVNRYELCVCLGKQFTWCQPLMFPLIGKFDRFWTNRHHRFYVKCICVVFVLVWLWTVSSKQSRSIQFRYCENYKLHTVYENYGEQNVQLHLIINIENGKNGREIINVVYQSIQCKFIRNRLVFSFCVHSSERNRMHRYFSIFSGSMKSNSNCIWVFA